MFNKLTPWIKNLLTKIKISLPVTNSKNAHKEKHSDKQKHQELYAKELSAINKFQEIYTGKQRQNRELWLDYFTSEEFLDVYHQYTFASMMRDIINKNIEK